MQCLRQQIQDLLFKINTMEILFGKIFEKPNLNNTTYNFVPKNAMKLRFNKSFDPTFSKVGQGVGRSPTVCYGFSIFRAYSINLSAAGEADSSE